MREFKRSNLDDDVMITKVLDNGLLRDPTINYSSYMFKFINARATLAKEVTYGFKYSITYNTIIYGYGKAGLFELMESVLTYMLEQWTCLPDVFTFNFVIGAYGNIKICVSLAGNIKRMEVFFHDMKHQRMKSNAVTYHSLVNGYGKAGHMPNTDSIVRHIDIMKDRYKALGMVEAAQSLENKNIMSEHNPVTKENGSAGVLDNFVEGERRRCNGGGGAVEEDGGGRGGAVKEEGGGGGWVVVG
ncbi:pentatricopeptide repeat-containing protein [Tanacetum coccineum]